MFITLGRWLPSFDRGDKTPVIFYARSPDMHGADAAKTTMKRFGLKHILIDEFDDLDAAQEYAKKYFNLAEFEFSPFPVDQTQVHFTQKSSP
jgi:hypothetical protein